MSLDHVGIHVKNYEESVEFYEKVLVALGNKKSMSVENEHGRGTGFGKYGPMFWIHGAPKGTDPQSVKSPTPVHIAFAASSRSAVDRFYDAAIAAGASDNGKPGLRKYHPFYYAAYVIDKEGNNIEAVNHFEMWTVILPLTVIAAVVVAYYFRG